MRTLPNRRRRSGNVLVLTLFMMIGMLGMVALSVDIGYLKVVNAELQRSADSAAIAATTRLMDEQRLPGQSEPGYYYTRATAGQFAGLNKIARDAPALATDDVNLGYMAYPFSPSGQLVTESPSLVNAVRVRIRRAPEQNGQVALFFARALGIPAVNVEGEATAAFVASVRGFKPPTPTSNVMILPFALDKETWDGLMAGGGTDNWQYDPLTGHVSQGADQIREVNLYPQGTGAPGNRGTVDIGSNNNSTCDIKRQIVEGISPADLAYLGGKIELGPDGTLPLNGDTGLSAGFKAELQSIVGQTRCIPLFSQVAGPGNNATYTIVGFAGIRVLDVVLTGSPNQKHLFIQPAYVKTPGAIPSTTTTSQFVYSPVQLVR